MRISRRMLIIAACFSAAVSVPALAADDVTMQLEMTRAEVQAKRQQIVSAAMNLSQAESDAFWPVYREFRNEMEGLLDRKVKLILDLAEHFDNVTDERAASMLAEFLDIKSKEVKVHKRYVRKFNKVLSARKVARFYQLENKLDNLINLDAAAQIPLVPVT